ncbi:ABC transporter substrate-binding protein [Celeribacter indicus]|uniref:Extracellular solute-binding protein n=1 Tax=Celeribacter indicus TaxID=1208324 RepID=A0A0B5E160_9RHOB|nr:sugar ABC transporter substrate-binding protein [Celeribacter indicus]AJE49024.1 extracellular solute-binding protein [Celeribacter indicus]SDW43949.1 sorbitol-binding protein /mannitol-binding protein [Celeribacter indicus]
MTTTFRALMGACAFGALATASMAETITVATVNNGDMIRMQGLMDEFKAEHPDIDVEWVTLEENVLRQRVTQDVATKGGQFDVMTIGNYEVPIWAKQSWLVPLTDMPEGYDEEDLMPAIADGLRQDGTLYAAPFYGESAMVMYRTDLAEAAGVTIPDAPNWGQIEEAAAAMTDRDNEIYGICLRGKAGWGENMAFISSMANSMGARWFDMDWHPQFDSEAWSETLTDYLDLMNNYGPPGGSGNGFNENLALFQQGKCGMWIDATVAASFVTDPEESTVADSVGFAQFPNKEGMEGTGHWLWSWNLAIPAGTQKEESAKAFVAWATSKEYTQLVAEREGWRAAPPGTRTSLYENQDYLDAAPFAEMTLNAINGVDILNPTVDEVPYIGSQWVGIPEFQGIGTAVGQQFSAALAGQVSAEQALQSAQQLTEREMTRAGYIQ